MAAAWWDIPYGPDGTADPENSRFLRLHAAPAVMPGGGVHATVVVLHGGYWKNKYGLDDAYGNAGTASLAPFFLQRSFAVVELEYRRRDHEGGGWPGTNEDVLAALKHMTALQQSAADAVDERMQAAQKALKCEKLLLVGHSAGACLALWAAHQLVPKPLVLAAAPVADLVRAHEMRVSDEGDAVELYMRQAPDGPSAESEYRKASPAALLPVQFPLLVAYGDKDADVPPQLVADYAQAAQSQSPELVSIAKIPDADHFDVVNASSKAWIDYIVPSLADLAARHWGEAAAAALRS
ncbi:unnamed protein product [Polarella glacialis]|uniref:Peptidase S9 prolyl oligopeptidase catalytic domain-containing protein n=1 Tax=Polarella glacialis TaxID=89957 RepID=A0A813GX44_POLGL|nr:unnamed protein product [Polarella glacialis]CAE8687144.1 unnamed protein product [Polarella glacialis]